MWHGVALCIVGELDRLCLSFLLYQLSVFLRIHHCPLPLCMLHVSVPVIILAMLIIITVMFVPLLLSLL